MSREIIGSPLKLPRDSKPSRFYPPPLSVRLLSNGNYLWITYFHSFPGPKGRAGFVVSSQASSARHSEAEVRRKILETGDVDVMILIRWHRPVSIW
jgi:hypothetical protein